MEGTKIEDKDLYRIALDIRNLEITLFWQRCNYFLVLNSALALGFFNLTMFGYSVLLAILGVVTSILWFAVSLGSKYWQSRWEYRLSEFERQVAPGLNFFAADRNIVQTDVKKSLKFNEHSFLRKPFDKLVLLKPSVSFMMMLLSLVFIVAWGVALALYLIFTQKSGHPVKLHMLSLRIQQENNN